MKKLLYALLPVLTIVASCSKEEEVVTPPAPNKYTLAISAEAGGTVSTEGGLYNEGSKITVTATPDGQFLFKEWSDGSTQNPREITVTSNLTLKASFIKKTYPLSVTIDGEGTVQEQVIIQGSTTETEYNAGTTVRLTATSNEGWEFSMWVVDGVVITENPIEVTIEKGREATVFFKVTQINFFTESPKYTGINSTSGTTYINSFSPKNILVSKDILSISIYDNWNEDRKNIKSKNYEYLDYNNDGKIDLFAFREHRGNKFLPTGYTNGDYVLYSDVFGSFDLVDSQPSRRMYEGRIEMNDFDGDNNPEMVIFSNEGHLSNLINLPVNTRQPLTYIDITIDGKLLVTYIGPETGSHDITSADIDGDGDVDIINFEWWMSDKPMGYKNSPLFYINDGNGNFTITRENFVFPEIFEKDSRPFSKLTVDSFDLDNDGIMDIIHTDGNSGESSIITECVSLNNQPCGTFKVPITGVIHITWGNTDSKFIFEESSVLSYGEFTEKNKSSLGFQFLDLNDDGMIDILSFGLYEDYSIGFIDVYYNYGNRNFSEPVEIDKWVVQDESNPNSGFIPIPYILHLTDVDSDGKFDLRPTVHYEGDWYMYYTEKNGAIMGEGTYWKNNGNGFDRIEVIYEE